MTRPEQLTERAYIQGQRSAWQRILSTACGNLGIDDPEAAHALWIDERLAAVAALREICEEHGDNDWPDNLHLADVIEKHLGRHL